MSVFESERKVTSPITIGDTKGTEAWLDEGVFTETGERAIRLSWHGKGTRALILSADDLRELLRRATEAGIL